MPKGICRTGIDYGEQAWNAAIGCDNPPSVCAVHDHCWARLGAERGRGVYGQWAPGDRFAPRFLPERLDGPRQVAKPSRVLVSFMGDLFCAGRPASQIEQVFQTMRDAWWHSYILLTKRPKEYLAWHERVGLPPNAWAGTTVTSMAEEDRLSDLLRLVEAGHPRVWVSYEPALGPLTSFPLTATGWPRHIAWLVIGGTSPASMPQPRPEWIREAVDAFRSQGRPVFLKSNLRPMRLDPAKWAWPGELIQEYPEGMVGHE